MRRSLRWGLAGVVLITLAVLAFTDGAPAPAPPSLIPAATRARAAMVDQFAAGRPAGRPVAEVPSTNESAAPRLTDVHEWPKALSRPVLGAALRDPFRALQPTPVPAVDVGHLAPMPVAPVVAPPVAPPMNYRYLGQLTDPDGKRVILITKGDKELTIASGSLLDDGFSVAGIQARHITILHAPTGARFEIPIPDSDDSSR